MQSVASSEDPRFPSTGQQAWGLARSLARFLTDGCRVVSEEEYARRLAICGGCPERADRRCARCGCYLAIKARGRGMRCPLGKWNDVEPDVAARGRAAEPVDS